VIVYGVTSLMTADRSASSGFSSGWVDRYQPFNNGRVDASSVVWATGRGTWVLLALACGWMLARRRWREAATLVAACALAALPLWSVWASIPPLSTRHCVPGALVTALYAGVFAARVLPHRKVLPLLWPVVLVAANWWGSPSFDINYQLSGDLYRQYRTNRAAFAAARQVAGEIAADPRPVQVWVGRPASPSILGRIDIIEIVRYQIACDAVDVRNHNVPCSDYDLQARRTDGTEKILFDARDAPPASFLGRTKYGPGDYFFLSMTRDGDPGLEALGLTVHRFDLRRVYRPPEHGGSPRSAP
jgi:hypothetical protein